MFVAPLKSSKLEKQGTWQPSLMTTHDHAMWYHWGTSQKQHMQIRATIRLWETQTGNRLDAVRTEALDMSTQSWTPTSVTRV